MNIEGVSIELQELSHPVPGKYIQEYLNIENSVRGKTYFGLTITAEVRDEVKNGKIFRILIGEKGIGHISYRIEGAAVVLNGFAIRPKFQNKGYGSAALKQMLQQLAAYESIELFVHPDNLSAFMLYEKFNFRFVERVENKYGDGQPRNRMKLIK